MVHFSYVTLPERLRSMTSTKGLDEVVEDGNPALYHACSMFGDSARLGTRVSYKNWTMRHAYQPFTL